MHKNSFGGRVPPDPSREHGRGKGIGKKGRERRRGNERGKERRGEEKRGYPPMLEMDRRHCQ